MDLKYQKAELKRRIKQEEKVLSEEEELLEKKIAKLKKETEDASNTQFAGGCLVYVLIIGLLSILGWWEDGDRGAIPASVTGLIICIFLSLVFFQKIYQRKRKRAN